jgi:uncharacterized protein (TIGR03437 family)
MTVAKTAPGISTVIVNQDGTINSPANAAARGSIVTLYGTGEGRVSPQLLWGDLSISTPFSMPDEAVAVGIGGQAAEVIYAGAAPLQPIGVLQINARIPATIPAGTAAVSVTVGDATSPGLVPLAVR